MKLLRNPVVVGILALIAVVMVIYQVVGPRAIQGLFGPKPATASATPATAAQVPQPPSAAAAPAAKPVAKFPPIRAVTYTNLDAALLPARGVEIAVIEPRF